MTDILSQLIRASFRDVEFPVAGSAFGFRHQHAKHKFIFRDEELVESLGRENPSYRYQIPFREDIAREPWKNLFTEVYPEFLKQCVDRTPGILTDNIHAAVRVVCVSFEETRDVSRRDGVDVSVEFVKAPRESDALYDPGSWVATYEGAKGAAGRFDREVEKVVLPSGVRPEPAMDLLGDIQRGLSSAAVGAERYNAKVLRAVGRVEKTMKLLDAVASPKNPATKLHGRRLQRALLKVIDSEDTTSSRPIRRHKVAAATTPTALAGKLRNSVGDILHLNPWLARSMRADAGVRIKYFENG